MRNRLNVLGRIVAVFIFGVLPTTGCPAPGGKLLPLANERVSVAFREDTEMTGETVQDDITVAASGIWSMGGTDIVLDVNNKSAQAVSIDFGRAKLTNGGQTATLMLIIEYVRRGDKQETKFLYERKKAQGEIVVNIAPGAQHRLQIAWTYPSDDSPGGKIGDRATLEIPVERAEGKQPSNFDFVFEYKGK